MTDDTNQRRAGAARIGMLAMGRMGAAMAARLVAQGHTVLCCTAGRSAATRARAQAAGAVECASLAEVVAGSDLLLSVASPSVAEGLAVEVAQICGTAPKTAARPVFVEANPLSSARFGRIRAALEAAGLELVDAGLFGLPPEGDRPPPRMLVAGKAAARLAPLDGVAAEVVEIGGVPGDAAFLKLLHCAASKGSNALLGTLAVAAARRDLETPFMAMLGRVAPDLAARLERSLAWMPADAGRWQGEMAEAAEELRALGLSADHVTGTRALLSLMQRSPLGGETRETRDPGRDWAGTAEALARMPDAGPAGGAFVLTLFTDDLDEARRGVAAGIDRIGPDLEVLGKDARQTGLATRVSVHDPAFPARLRPHIGDSTLFARTDPVNPRSAEAIDALLAAGVAHLMLPYFLDAAAVERFVSIVDGRARVTLLCETAPALFRLREILRVPGVDEVHFGLTDLMLSTGVGSRFEVLCSDLLARAAEQVHEAGLPLHAGAVAAVSDATMPFPADEVLARYAQLGVTGSLVSRALMESGAARDDLAGENALVRARMDHWAGAGAGGVAAAVEGLRRRIAARRGAGLSVP